MLYVCVQQFNAEIKTVVESFFQPDPSWFKHFNIWYYLYYFEQNRKVIV